MFVSKISPIEVFAFVYNLILFLFYLELEWTFTSSHCVNKTSLELKKFLNLFLYVFYLRTMYMQCLQRPEGVSGPWNRSYALLLATIWMVGNQKEANKNQGVQNIWLNILTCFLFIWIFVLCLVFILGGRVDTMSVTICL